MTPPDDGTPGRAPDAASPDDLGFPLPAPTAPSASRVMVVASIGVVVLGAAFLAGYLPRRTARLALEAGATEEARGATRVDVVAPKVLTSDRKLVLPGSVQPLEDTILYPRANGYVREFSVDIGDHVKANQQLAEIETPELDQEIDQAKAQLLQAEAGLGQAKANRDYSKTTLDRYKLLTPAGVATKQELEQKGAQALVDESNVVVAEAAISVQRANLKRLTQLKSFARVVAPFDGIIASRSIARGALVTSGNGTPLFRIVAADPVRVFVQVPQDGAGTIVPGLKATVTVREYQSRPFSGEVARTAGVLDPATRTMLADVRVPNPKNELLSGMYAEVAMDLPVSHRVFELPATALSSDARGVRVAIVGADGKIRLIPVVIERDSGATIQISSGLDGTERVVKIANPDLSDGMAVEVRQ